MKSKLSMPPGTLCPSGDLRNRTFGGSRTDRIASAISRFRLQLDPDDSVAGSIAAKAKVDAPLPQPKLPKQAFAHKRRWLKVRKKLSPNHARHIIRVLMPRDAFADPTETYALNHELNQMPGKLVSQSAPLNEELGIPRINSIRSRSLPRLANA